MCCNFDRAPGNFHLNDESIAFGQQGNNRTVKFNGIYDRTPPTLGARFSRYFRRIELFEKVAEIADEAFHLFDELIELTGNREIYNTLHDLHHSAHTVEHFLHSFCFLGDITRLSQRSLFLDQEGNKLDYIRCASKLCHVVSHLFATLDFLKRLNILPLGPIEPSVRYYSLISAAGYALWTVALIWQRSQGRYDEQFRHELRIHLSGCLFEATRLTEFSQGFSPIIQTAIQKLGSIAGIIQAWMSVNRLLESDLEEIEFKIVLPAEDNQSPPRKGLRHHANSSFSLCVACTDSGSSISTRNEGQSIT